MPRAYPRMRTIVLGVSIHLGAVTAAAIYFQDLRPGMERLESLGYGVVRVHEESDLPRFARELARRLYEANPRGFRA